MWGHCVWWCACVGGGSGGDGDGGVIGFGGDGVVRMVVTVW